jgi:hypothetical protein
MKGKPELNNERNLMPVCRECHSSGAVNSYFARVWFWDQQVEKYGRDDMITWWESLPMKKKERFW